MSYKKEIQAPLSGQSKFFLNANGYTWLVYQAGLQMAHINSLIRRITVVSDLSNTQKSGSW